MIILSLSKLNAQTESLVGFLPYLFPQEPRTRARHSGDVDNTSPCPDSLRRDDTRRPHVADKIRVYGISRTSDISRVSSLDNKTARVIHEETKNNGAVYSANT